MLNNYILLCSFLILFTYIWILLYYRFYTLYGFLYIYYIDRIGLPISSWSTTGAAGETSQSISPESIHWLKRLAHDPATERHNNNVMGPVRKREKLKRMINIWHTFRENGVNFKPFVYSSMGLFNETGVDLNPKGCEEMVWQGQFCLPSLCSSHS
jgi:hypothetical protein